jgi:hypothetical protein
MEIYLIAVLAFFPVIVFILSRESLFDKDFIKVYLFFETLAFIISFFKSNLLLSVGLKLPLISHLLFLLMRYIYLKFYHEEWKDTYMGTGEGKWKDFMFNSVFVLGSVVIFVVMYILIVVE